MVQPKFGDITQAISILFSFFILASKFSFSLSFLLPSLFLSSFFLHFTFGHSLLLIHSPFLFLQHISVILWVSPTFLFTFFSCSSIFHSFIHFSWKQIIKSDDNKLNYFSKLSFSSLSLKLNWLILYLLFFLVFLLLFLFILSFVSFSRCLFSHFYSPFLYFLCFQLFYCYFYFPFWSQNCCIFFKKCQ